MAINILIVKEDLVTVLPISLEIKDIESNHNFYLFKKSAQELGLSFIPTIDAYGKTVFNELQLEPLGREIKILRNHKDIDQQTVDSLEKALNAAKENSCSYIKFVGD